MTRQLSCRSRTCGQQHMPAWWNREKVWYDSQLIGIVQNEQPATVGLEPGLDRLHDDLLLFDFSLWQAQERGYGYIGRNQCLSTLRPRPEDHLVVLVIAIRILQNKLALAD